MKSVRNGALALAFLGAAAVLASPISAAEAAVEDAIRIEDPAAPISGAHAEADANSGGTDVSVDRDAVPRRVPPVQKPGASIQNPGADVKSE